MHLTLIPTLVLAVAGAIVYILSSNGKAMELGRLAFACGLLAAAFNNFGVH